MGRAGATTRSALGPAVLCAVVLLVVAMPQQARAVQVVHAAERPKAVWAAQVSGASACPGRRVRTLTFATGSVLVHRSGGYVCAVTVTVSGKAGTKRQMSVGVRARGGRAVVDSGSFAHRAGPVTVHAGNRCVWVTGKVAKSSVGSGWILC
ncbi:hypothetical protein AB0F09_22170 [Streptomyces olivaceus]|uniref:hypothetical protein n=1 Tax=Streptomyces olivaceus TaxID=47716 RepID=UPI003411A0D6